MLSMCISSNVSQVKESGKLSEHLYGANCCCFHVWFVESNVGSRSSDVQRILFNTLSHLTRTHQIPTYKKYKKSTPDLCFE